MRKIFTMFVLVILATMWVGGPSTVAALEDKLVIVTSYPKDLTGVFKKAFEAFYSR